MFLRAASWRVTHYSYRHLGHKRHRETLWNSLAAHPKNYHRNGSTRHYFWNISHKYYSHRISFISFLSNAKLHLEVRHRHFLLHGRMFCFLCANASCWRTWFNSPFIRKVAGWLLFLLLASKQMYQTEIFLVFLSLFQATVQILSSLVLMRSFSFHKRRISRTSAFPGSACFRLI